MEGKNIPTKTVRAWEAMGFVWDLLFALVIPTVFFGFGGGWLDKRLGTAPFFTVIGIVLALAVAAILVYRKARRLGELMEDVEDKKE
jgi:F0F1-type ATP synthase assembly protein I